jgi:hypothetical protein
MNRVHACSMIAAFAGFLVFQDIAALGQIQIPPELRTGNVKVDYLELRDPGMGNPKKYAAFKRYQAIYESMKKREVLEEYAAFLSPLRLPVVLRIRTQECGESDALYEPQEWAIKYCYEYLDEVEALAQKALSESVRRCGGQKKQDFMGGHPYRRRQGRSTDHGLNVPACQVLSPDEPSMGQSLSDRDLSLCPTLGSV